MYCNVLSALTCSWYYKTYTTVHNTKKILKLTRWKKVKNEKVKEKVITDVLMKVHFSNHYKENSSSDTIANKTVSKML